MTLFGTSSRKVLSYAVFDRGLFEGETFISRQAELPLKAMTDDEHTAALDRARRIVSSLVPVTCSSMCTKGESNVLGSMMWLLGRPLDCARSHVARLIDCVHLPSRLGCVKKPADQRGWTRFE